MSHIAGNRPAPFGAITIYRATEALTGAADALRAARMRRGTALAAFSPAQLEDIGLSIADVPAGRRRGTLARLVATIRAWNARRRTIAELERLSEAQLDDIGLTRGQIELLRLGHPLV